jgi:hypothetical protein
MQLKEVCYGSRFASLAAWCSNSSNHRVVAFLSLNPRGVSDRKSGVRKSVLALRARRALGETGLAICWSPFNEMLNGRPRNY